MRLPLTAEMPPAIVLPACSSRIEPPFFERSTKVVPVAVPIEPALWKIAALASLSMGFVTFAQARRPSISTRIVARAMPLSFRVVSGRILYTCVAMWPGSAPRCASRAASSSARGVVFSWRKPPVSVSRAT